MKIAQWLASHPGHIVTVAPELTLEEVVDRLLAEPCLRDVYVVTEDGRLIGHLSHRRLAHLILAEHRPTHSPRQLMERVAGGHAKDLMNAQLAYAREEEEWDEVVHRLLEHEVEDLPVLDGQGRLAGAINLTAVLREIRRES